MFDRDPDPPEDLPDVGDLKIDRDARDRFWATLILVGALLSPVILVVFWCLWFQVHNLWD